MHVHVIHVRLIDDGCIVHSNTEREIMMRERESDMIIYFLLFEKIKIMNGRKYGSMDWRVYGLH